MWGYHLVSITGHNESTMNYGECRLNLYIRCKFNTTEFLFQNLAISLIVVFVTYDIILV